MLVNLKAYFVLKETYLSYVNTFKNLVRFDAFRKLVADELGTECGFSFTDIGL